MQHNRFTRLFALVMVTVLAFSLVGGVVAQDEEPKILYTGRQMGPSDIPTVDPGLVEDVPSAQIAWELFPELLRLDEETVEVNPGMATSYEVSEDGLTYTFHLLEEVPWVRYNADSGAVEQIMDESGNPRYVTAQDFVYGITRTANSETGSPYQYVLLPWIEGAVEFSETGDPSVLGLTAVDDYTLEVRVPEASSVTPLIFAMWITAAQPQFAIEEYGDLWIEPANIATYGPFALMEWQRGDGGSLTLVDNPFWPGTDSIPQPELDQVVFRFLDDEPQLAEFEAGNLHVAEAPESAIDRILADENLSAAYNVASGTCTYYYGFNTESPFFSDARVRRAFSMAIDREAIVENVTNAGEIPASFFALPSLVAAPTAEQFPDMGISTDLEAAQALWQEYVDETGTDPASFTPTLLYNDSALHASIAQAVQQQWNEAFGVNVQLAVQDFATYLETRGEFDVYRAGWCFDYPDAHNFYYDTPFHSDGLSENDTHWSNAEFDRLIDEAFVLEDPAARAELYAQAEQILVHDDAAMAPIYFYVTKDLTAPGVERTYSQITREAYEKWDLTE